MGAPTQLQKFSVLEMHDALTLAKSTAMDFRSLEARTKALDHFKTSILPMVEWLDKSIKDCFPGREPKLRDASAKRALPLFKWVNRLPPVALTRKGEWITYISSEGALVKLSSELVAERISVASWDILGSIPWPRKAQHLLGAEFLGMKEIVEHCAFLKYLALGIEELDKALKEREQRLQVMRHNLSFLNSFVRGMDPLEYGAPKTALPGYALFGRYPGHTNRVSGTYFVSAPVEKQAKERNEKKSVGSDYSYYVFEEHRWFKKLEQFLSQVERTIEDVSASEYSKRDPISDEEKKVILEYVNRIGNPPQ